MITQYANRDASHPWPAVRIIKGLPGHPEGCIRFPRPELRERWERLGICQLIVEADIVPLPQKKKRGRPRRIVDGDQ